MMDGSTIAFEPNLTNANVRSNKVGLPLFFVLLFGSWIGTVPMILDSYGKAVSGPLKLLQILMLFGPGLVAVLCTWLNEGRAGLRDLFGRLFRWKVSIVWYAVALVVPPLIFTLALLFGNATGQTSMSFPAATTFLSSFFVTLGVYAVLNTEELAWRGYALPKLTSRIGLIPATLVIGVLWTLFHLPLFWMKGGHPVGLPFWLFTAMVLSITFLFSGAYYASGSSLLIVHLLHQAINASVEALRVYPKATHSIIPMIVASVLLMTVAIPLILIARKRVSSNALEPSR